VNLPLIRGWNIPSRAPIAGRLHNTTTRFTKETTMIEKTGEVKATAETQRVLDTDPRVLRWREIENGYAFRFDYTEKRVDAIHRVLARDLGIVELS
jgi:hypothetical protein